MREEENYMGSSDDEKSDSQTDSLDSNHTPGDSTEPDVTIEPDAFVEELKGDYVVDLLNGSIWFYCAHESTIILVFESRWREQYRELLSNNLEVKLYVVILFLLSFSS